MTFNYSRFLSNIVQRYKGAFQSQMVMETFMYHVAMVNDLVPEFKIDDNPQGALVMAATAVT